MDSSVGEERKPAHTQSTGTMPDDSGGIVHAGPQRRSSVTLGRSPQEAARRTLALLRDLRGIIEGPGTSRTRHRCGTELVIPLPGRRAHFEWVSAECTGGLDGKAKEEEADTQPPERIRRTEAPSRLGTGFPET
jgi:hypothetical protein